MRVIKLLSLLTISLLFTFCSSKSDKEIFDGAKGLLTEKKYDEACAAFEKFSIEQSSSELAPQAILECAKLYQGQVVKNVGGKESFIKAVDLYKKIFNDYPKSKEAENSLFMAGFILANELSDLDSAKKTYELFLEKYPEGDLADDAQVELKNLGKSPEEILMQKIQQENPNVNAS